ncbi:acyl-CoA thioesterase II [Cladophialophora immunda]|uniref:Acyl-CoA thioesterase II n=1 Tax=Cladophialophora immunda TaxID=569365 RepID=A0A0D2CL98_9EURO|nr:acyl-CoA thioesterase II [Cladophialophora immunda]KIW30855.1 acyl-CoA thioesterase II [Cladophialophora immunda]OQV02168.1 hypothetical protein CLAIMM_07407 [Cladophialophora immunda]
MTDAKRLPWLRLMALKQTDKDVYESVHRAWPSSGGNRAFGGHVYAQSAIAASKTVEDGLVIHNITGHFILGGSVLAPFVYHVRRIGDGRSFSWRTVEVFQGSQPSARPCFVATISFKRYEESKSWIPLEHQAETFEDFTKTYSSILDRTKPEETPLAPGADAPWWYNANNDAWRVTNDMFPGVDIRKVDMSGHNETSRHPTRHPAAGRRQLCFYRLIVDAESRELLNKTTSEILNLHAAAHLYASDRNSLFLIPRAHGLADRIAVLASLSHTVIFHGDPARLKMLDEQGNPIWFVQEAWTSNSGAGRGCHESRLWNYKSGRVVASTIQDGMVRIPRDPGRVPKYYQQAETALQSVSNPSPKL